MRFGGSTRQLILGIATAGVLMLPLRAAHAISFSFSPFGDEPVQGVLNTTFTAGLGVRMQAPSQNLIGKSNLNPNVCAPPYQSCQGLFKDQYFPAEHLYAAPGAASVNGDNGDLNYSHKGDIFQAPLKMTQDLTLTWRNFGFFGRILYFYDIVNNNLTEYHPNRITPENYLSVGRETNVVDFFGAGALTGLGNTLSTLPAPLGALGQNIVNLVNSGAGALLPIRVYGPGGVVRNRRSDPSVLNQAGTALQYLDSYVFGKFNVLGHSLTVKLGRQTISWGESTTLVINSINQTNPVNANNFYRIGNQIEEDFQPLNMAYLSFDPFENATIEGYYDLEWKPLEAPAPGTYFSDIDVGTYNAAISQGVSASFGGSAEDPACKGALLDNPLAGITPTCTNIQRLPDWEPRTSGQYGFHFDYYADNFNNGTDFGLYYEHYHSQLPYASFFATYPSCARAEGNAYNNNATNIASFLADCPNLPLGVALLGGDPATATSSAVPFDTAKFVLEYPENIDLYGFSFNTTFGNYSVQGEVAYRPNKPMQVDAQDLAFAAFGPTLTRCGQPGTFCTMKR